MKYLVIAKPRGMFPKDPVDILKKAKEWINARITDGIVDCVYSFLNGGAVGVINAKSHEDVMEQIMSYPLWLYLEFEVQALCDINQTFDMEMRALQGQV